MRHLVPLPMTNEEVIFDAAAAYFREHGATDSNGLHLTDHIMSALGQVEEQERFDDDFVPVVERAFNRLRLLGYRCEQNWHCCRTCGWDAIPWEDADHAIWYHSQDRDAGVRTGRVYLIWTGDPLVIRQALEAEGLTVEHDGTTGQRIQIRLTGGDG